MPQGNIRVTLPLVQVIYSEAIADSLPLVAPLAVTESKNPTTCPDLWHIENTIWYGHDSLHLHVLV